MTKWQPKQNCWDFMQCGRQPGGAREKELGICPACTDAASDGTNGGRKAGRACWMIAGTLCGGVVQGSFALKSVSCFACEFFQKVKAEEAGNFALRSRK